MLIFNNQTRKRNKVFIFLFFLISNNIFSNEGSSEYVEYIHHPIMSAKIGEVEKQYALIDKEESSIVSALVLFRRALLTSKEEDVVEAFMYWNDLYVLSQFNNPMTLAYIGTLESMQAAATKGVVKKINLVKSGLEKLEVAIGQILESKDELAIGYVYFLIGNVCSNLPTFFKEFRKDTIPYLDKSEAHYKKAFKKLKKQNLAVDELEPSLYSVLYDSYGRWYEKSKKISNAIKFYEKAYAFIETKKYELTDTLQNKLSELKK